MHRRLRPLALLLATLPLAATAQVVGVAVDSKVRLVDGKAAVVPSSAGDSAPG